MFPTSNRDLPVPDALEAPDAGFQLGFGVYVASILTGAALVGGVALEASAGVLVATVPTAVSVGLVVGCVLAAGAEGMPERIGRSRRRMAGSFLPAVAFAGVTIAAISLPSIPTGFAFAGGFATVAALAGAAVVATMARTRYVAAVTPDEPIAAWRWRSPNRERRWYAIGVGFGAIALWAARWGGWFLVAQWTAFALYAVVRGLEVGDRLGGLEPGLDESGIVRELRIHEVGLVVERPFATRLVPWRDVEGVTLTDDALVVERSWLDVRCDRSAIDDPGAVRAAIERARNRARLENEGE